MRKSWNFITDIQYESLSCILLYFDGYSTTIFHGAVLILYNYRLLKRSTHDHEDRLYYCFIKLSGVFLHKDCHIHNYCFFIAPAAVSLAWLKIETPNTPLNTFCGVLTLRYTRVNAVSANQRRAKWGKIPDHLIICNTGSKYLLISNFSCLLQRWLTEQRSQCPHCRYVVRLGVGYYWTVGWIAKQFRPTDLFCLTSTFWLTFSLFALQSCLTS